MKRLIRFLLTPRGQKFDRFLVRMTGGSLLNGLMARREGFEPQPMLVLGTAGRRTGRHREVVLPYFSFEEGVVVVGSKGGAPDDPAWVTNIRHNPNAEIVVNRKRRHVNARIVQGPQRTALWQRITSKMAVYNKYQSRTEREIPVVLLEPRQR